MSEIKLEIKPPTKVENSKVENSIEMRDERITRPVMTNYERANVIGMRLEQLQRGATPFVDVSDMENPTVRDVAMRELREGRIPFKIIRKRPDGQKEHWPIADLAFTSSL